MSDSLEPSFPFTFGTVIQNVIHQDKNLYSQILHKLQDNQSSISSLWTDSQTLNSIPIVRNIDFIVTFNYHHDRAIIEKLKAVLPEENVDYLIDALKLRILELWELTERDKGVSSDVFIQEYVSAEKEVWCLDRLTGEIWLTLPEVDFYSVCFSRTFPLLSRLELQTLKQKSVFFSGLSTGSPVVLDLVGLGLGKVVGVDPDLVNLSNIRMGIGDKHVGYAKAVWLGYQICQMNPYCTVEMYPRLLEDEELSDIVQATDLICEMTDAFVNKVRVRQLARKHNKVVCMGSGFGELPSFTFEKPSEKLFLRSLTDAELAVLSDSKSDPVERAKKAIEIVGVHNLSLRALLNFIFVAKLGYWSQLKTTASTVGGSLGFAMAMQLIGAEVSAETNISLIDIFVSSDSQKRRNQQLFDELKLDKRFSELLKPYATLEEAVKDLLNKILGVKL